MKSILTIATIAVVLTGCALAQKKLDVAPQQPTGTDWLDAPTPDGSPTLRETSNWLAQTMTAYGGGEHALGEYFYLDLHIGNDCTLSYTYKTIHLKASISGPKRTGKPDMTTVSIPLGAVTEIGRDSDSSEIWRQSRGLLIKTGDVAAVRTGTSVGNQDEWDLSRSPEPTPGGEMPQNPRDIVPRVINALEHAVSLCRSAYTAPVKAKQPF